METIIGNHISEIGEVQFGSSYPVVDRDTLRVIAVVDGNYPAEFNGGNWVTGAIVNGEIVTGEQYSDFAVAASK